MRSAKPLLDSQPIAESELILNKDGSIYHLALRPEHIADNLIVVGDQDRVARISSHFERIEHQISNREFVTHTGYYKGKRVTALSTGIGCDNIDIVLNELDAIVNIDLETKLPKTEHKALNILRLGTSGSLQADIPVDSFVASKYGLGMDGLLGFYETEYDADETELCEQIKSHTNWHADSNPPYMVKASSTLLQKIGHDMTQGITATANGFYGPQGRVLRLNTKAEGFNELLRSFSHNGERITNFEMETSALYGLSALLGHNACTVCAIIANRYAKAYSKDYKQTIDNLIEIVLDRLTA
jgi:uridine phosphorylase